MLFGKDRWGCSPENQLGNGSAATCLTYLAFALSSKKLGIAIPLGDGAFLLLLTVIGIFGKLYKNLNSRRARPAQIFAPARD